MLATPHAFAYCGLLLGVLLILFCGVTASFGLYLLTRSAAKVGGRDSSFFKITNRTIPWAARWFDAAIALKVSGRDRVRGEEKEGRERERWTT